MIVYIPESPKFTFAQGDETRTLEILQKIFAQNTGKPASEYEVKSIDKDKEFVESVVKDSNFFKFMWTQTVPLFKKPHLKNTLTACFLQFTICLTSNGFNTFFPEILNKVYLWLESDPMHLTSTVCQIIDHQGLGSTNSTVTCLTKLEPNTFLNVTTVILLHLIGWSVISVIINRVGKLIIIVSIMFTGATCAILLIFIEIPMVSTYLYTLLLAVGVNMSVVNSSTVELFPTSLR